ELQHFFDVVNTIPASCVVYRGSGLERYGYWPEDIAWSADWHYWQRIIKGSRYKLAYVPKATTLHFSANWRKSRHANARRAGNPPAIADQSPWWPSALRYTIPPGRPEQAVVYEAMKAGGADWCTRVRDALFVVVNRLAWDHVKTSPG